MAFDFYDVEGNMQPLQVPVSLPICMQLCTSYRPEGPQHAQLSNNCVKILAAMLMLTPLPLTMNGRMYCMLYSIIQFRLHA